LAAISIACSRWSSASVVVGIRASDPRLFDEFTNAGDAAGCSVIVAKVDAIRVLKIEEQKHLPTGTHKLTLEPLAVIAGNLDPSTHPKLDLVVWIVDAPGMMIKTEPHVGDTVMAVVMWNDKSVEPGPCDFMPGQSGLVVLDGLGDKHVHETLERIRAGRAAAKAQEEAEAKRAETQPAGAKP
jgi:hypothetical protein